MECSCSVGINNDGEGGSWSFRWRKAAKPNICYECKEKINKSDMYAFHTIFSEDGIGNFVLCVDCNEITETFFSDGWIFGRVIEDLHEYLNDNWQSDLPSSCISQLSSKVRDKVCDYLQEYQEK